MTSATTRRRRAASDTTGAGRSAGRASTPASSTGASSTATSATSQRRRRRADLGPQRILAVAELDRGVELGLARRAVGQVGQELVHRGVGQDAVEILIDAAVTAHVEPRDRASRASRSFLRARRIRVPTVDLGTPSAAAMAM
jgi:hypothetical protein